MASYSATKKNKPISSSGAVGAFDTFNTDNEVGFYNPNEEINRSDRTLDWDSKLLASYNFPRDLLVSTNFHHQSGEAFAGVVRFEGGVTRRVLMESVNATARCAKIANPFEELQT